jgi:hypothetical protein
MPTRIRLHKLATLSNKEAFQATLGIRPSSHPQGNSLHGNFSSNPPHFARSFVQLAIEKYRYIEIF